LTPHLEHLLSRAVCSGVQVQEDGSFTQPYLAQAKSFSRLCQYTFEPLTAQYILLNVQMVHDEFAELFPGQVTAVATVHDTSKLEGLAACYKANNLKLWDLVGDYSSKKRAGKNIKRLQVIWIFFLPRVSFFEGLGDRRRQLLNVICKTTIRWRSPAFEQEHVQECLCICGHYWNIIIVCCRCMKCIKKSVHLA